MYEILKQYRENAALRDSFNQLAEETFGLNFEGWYRNGFWGDNYEPYSIFEDGKIVANVSLNRTDLLIDGTQKRIYQLGTVMTHPDYRNRGYIRILMAEIEKDTADADGIYLFANDSVVEFYPKFGFVKGEEYLYTRTVAQTGECRMENVPMNSAEGWQKLEKAMEMGEPLSMCAMVENSGLIFFYVSQFMQGNVYYDETLNAWAIAELEDGALMLHNVFAPEGVTQDAVIAAFGADVKTVSLGFVPKDSSGFTCEAYREEDSTFFVKGEAFRENEWGKNRIPSLSHA